MTARRLLSLGIAGCTVAAATPALAQPEMTYEPGNYEYARPAPVQPPLQPPVVYQQQPVVQAVPHSTYDDQGYDDRDYDGSRKYDERGDYEVEEVYTTQAHHGGQTYHPAPHHAYPAHHAQHSGPAYPPQPAFDREAWLDQCRAQYGRDRRGRGDGKLGGGILGAAVGGVIGNRVADGDRLAGTLIGAGVGGIAGAVLGSVISGSGNNRRAGDECETYLDRYMAGGYGQQGYYGHGYGYGYTHGYATQMTYVPVLVQVPQRAIVRETVREEWVEETRTHHHSHARPARPAKVHYTPAPAPKPIKGKTRYIKQR